MRPRAKRAEREVKRVLKRVGSVAELQEIVEKVKDDVDAQEDQDTEGRVPGRIMEGKKTSFTHNDLVKMFGMVKFVPEETILITFQGVPYQLYGGYTMQVPGCIETAYRNHKKELRDSADNAELRSKGVIVELNAGALA